MDKITLFNKDDILYVSNHYVTYMNDEKHFTYEDKILFIWNYCDYIFNNIYCNNDDFVEGRIVFENFCLKSFTLQYVIITKKKINDKNLNDLCLFNFDPEIQKYIIESKIIIEIYDVNNLQVEFSFCDNDDRIYRPLIGFISSPYMFDNIKTKVRHPMWHDSEYYINSKTRYFITKFIPNHNIKSVCIFNPSNKRSIHYLYSDRMEIKN